MTTLVIPAGLADEFRELAQLDVESGGVLEARIARQPDGGLRLIATTYHPVGDDAYVERGPFGLTVSSDGYVPALRRARENKSVAIWVHTHPGADATPRHSEHDDAVDASLADLFADRTGTGLYASLVVAAPDGDLSFAGRVTGDIADDVDVVLSVDGAVVMHRVHGRPLLADSEIDSRHVLAFGRKLPAVVGSLRYAVVGSGGTGSATAEQLVRLGARDLVIIDPDTLSISNLTRVYGSTPADIGRPKVEVLADHLRAIAPDIHVVAVPGSVTDEQVMRQLVGRDVIFGCTDDNAGRLRLSRFAYYYGALLIDCGVKLSTGQDGLLDGIHGRVSVVHQGAACLLCRERIDRARAAAEERADAVNERLAAEGYGPSAPGTEPAVIVYTTLVAASAVNELLERLAGYGEQPRDTETLLRIHDRQVRTNRAGSRPGCYCDPDNSKFRAGDTVPMLNLNWAVPA